MEEGMSAELVASEVFLLMRRDFRVSRNVRALWYFDHLGEVVSIEPERLPRESTPEHAHKDLEVVGAVAASEHHEPADEQSIYRVCPDTVITCLSKMYRLAFILDLSPSLAISDASSASILFNKQFSCLRCCLAGVCKQFTIPGSSRVYAPQLYVTVLAYTPFLAATCDQVLLQGCPLTADTLAAVLEQLQVALHGFIDSLAAYVRPLSRRLNGARRRRRDERENELITGNLFTADDAARRPSNCSSRDERQRKDSQSEESDELAEAGLVPNDWILINMLRLGLIAVQLLPENTQSSIIILTDGVVGMPDAHAMQAVLTQLRSYTVSVSFVQIAPKLFSTTGLGHVSYPELLQFLAAATFGSYMPDCSGCAEVHPPELDCLNAYHRAFLCWSFQRALKDHRHLDSVLQPWLSESPASELLCRRYHSMTLGTSFHTVLYVRLREGYTVKRVCLAHPSGAESKYRLRVELRLPWKPQVSLEYHISTEWPVPHDSAPKIHIDIDVDGPYDFLKDVLTETSIQSVRSPFRKAVLQAFIQTVQTLTQADKLLLHLHSFRRRSTYYNVPDSVRDGNPLFYMPPNSDVPVICSKELEKKCPDFCEFWRPLCTLDMSIWQKWLHTHSLRMLLTQDVPLSSHLHVASAAGRFGQILCRQAAVALHDVLRRDASFTLLDQHSYVKFEYGDDEKVVPAYFYIIRTVLKPPCLVLKLAFLGGIRGAVRHKIVSELRANLLGLSVKQRPVLPPDSGLSRSLPLLTREVAALRLMGKPLERVLVRYERVPRDLYKLVRLEARVDEAQARSVILHNALARYFCARRWIWQLRRPIAKGYTLPNDAAGYILQSLVRRRLNEGFCFAAGANGIVNLAREVALENGQRLLVQYVLFPPLGATGAPSVDGGRRRHKRSDSSADASEAEAAEADSETQLVVELWVEPQDGCIDPDDIPLQSDGQPTLSYHDLFELVGEADGQIICGLSTFEHLRLIAELHLFHSPTRCLRRSHSLKCTQSPSRAATERRVDARGSRVCVMPSCFNLAALLRHCQRAALLFSTLAYEPDEEAESGARNAVLLDSLHAELALSHDAVLRVADSADLWRLVGADVDQLAWLADVAAPPPTVWPALAVYVKRVSDWRLLLVAAPASLDDLLLLAGSPPNAPAGLTLPLFVFNCYEPVVAARGCTLDPAAYRSAAALAPNILEDFRITGESVLTSLHRQISRLTQRSFDSSDGEASGSDDERHWFYRGRSRAISELSATGGGEQDALDADAQFSFAAFCARLDSALYARAYVCGVFEALRQELAVSRSDVAHAIDGRCDEFNIEVDLSEFAPLVCRHLAAYADDMAGDAHSRRDTVDTDRTSFTLRTSSMDLEPHPAFCTFSCAADHSDLTNAFNEVLRRNFKPLPSYPSHYFYAPTLDAAPSVASGTEADEWTKDEVSAESDMEVLPKSSFEHSVEFIPSDAEGTQRDDSPFSYRSTQHSSGTLSRSEGSTDVEMALKSFENALSDTLSELSDSPVAMRACPLFLHLCCSIRLFNRIFTCTVDSLPVCLVNLLQKARFDAWDLDLRNLELTLDICVLTVLPAQGGVDLLEARLCASPGDSAKSPTTSAGAASEFAYDDASRLASPLADLPDAERDLLGALKTAAEWLVARESLFAPTRLAPPLIAVDRLERVVGALADFAKLDERPQPELLTVALSFVMRDDECLARLAAKLADAQLSYTSLSCLESTFFACSVVDADGFAEWMRELQLAEAGAPPADCFRLLDAARRHAGLCQSSEEAHFAPQDFAAPALNLDAAVFDEDVQHPPDTEDAAASGGSSLTTPRVCLERSLSFSGFSGRFHRLRNKMVLQAGASPRPPPSHAPATGHSSMFDVRERAARLPSAGSIRWHLRAGDDESGSSFPTMSQAELMDNDAGYEPDSSEYLAVDEPAGAVCLDDSRDLRDFNERLQLLNDFWLILRLEGGQAVVRFFERFAGVHRPLVEELRSLLHRLVTQVNQEMLLESLRDTRQCDSLLVVDRDESPWRRRRSSENLVNSIEADDDQSPAAALAAAARFWPGAFACACVWHCWITVHPRLLKTGVAKNKVAKGLLKQILSKFLVTNRKDLYVATDENGAIFYLRLHDSAKSVDAPLLEELKSPPADGDDDAAMTSRRFENSLLLAAYGLEQPGNDIVEQLKGALQRKLDGKVLEVLAGTLFRNPNCRLTPDDVLFMQPDARRPRAVLRYVLPAQAMAHLYAVDYYLRQHISLFAHAPNYVTASGAPRGGVVWFRPLLAATAAAKDDDNGGGASGVPTDAAAAARSHRGFFLYNRPQSAGAAAAGIACVHLSFVDCWGNPTGVIHTDAVDPDGFDAFFGGRADLAALTRTQLWNVSPEPIGRRARRRRGGPPALVQLALWERGDVAVEEWLTPRLRHCVEQALADLVTEYGLLVAPVYQTLGGQPSSSWTTESKIGGRRSMGEMKLDAKESERLATLTKARQRSCSAAVLPSLNAPPPLSADPRRPESARASKPSGGFFNFDLLQAVIRRSSGSTSPSALGVDAAAARSSTKSASSAASVAELPSTAAAAAMESRHVQLNGVYARTAAAWFEQAIGARGPLPGLVERSLHTLDAAAAALDVLAEAVPRLRAHFADDDFACFRSVPGLFDDASYGLLTVNQLLALSKNRGPGDLGEPADVEQPVSFVLIGHDLQQWKRTVSGSYKQNSAANVRKSLEQPSQRFMASYSSEDRGFVPRQKLLLVLVRGCTLTVYVYNWTAESASVIHRLFVKLTCWQNAKLRLIRQICLQKMGICHLTSVDPRESGANPYLSMYWSNAESFLRGGGLPTQQLGRTNFAALEPQYGQLLLNPYRYADSVVLEPLVKAGTIFEEHVTQLRSLRLQLKHLLREQLEAREVFKQWRQLEASSDDGGERPAIDEEVLRRMVAKSRLVHYVSSPLLFEPSWRTSVTRVRVPLDASDSALAAAHKPVAPPPPVSPNKHKSSSRHSSGSRSPTRTPAAVQREAFTLAGRPDAWHYQLQHLLVQEYVGYLASMGLRLVDVRRRGDDKSDADKGDAYRFDPFGPAASPDVWLELTHAAGVLLVSLSFRQPYFVVQYFVWDAAQLHASVRPQLSAEALPSFCLCWARLIAKSHIHSFCYDFNLKMVAAYLAGGRHVMLSPGYHMNGFLVDFLHYYACRPSHARNCLYEERVTFADLGVAPATLYDHLLNHDQAYGLRVVRMRVPAAAAGADAETDYLLVSEGAYEYARDEHYQVLRVVLLDDREPTDGRRLSLNTLKLKFYVLFVSAAAVTTPLADSGDASTESPGEFRRLVNADSLNESDSDDETVDGGESALVRARTQVERSTRTIPLPRRRATSVFADDQSATLTMTEACRTLSDMVADRFEVVRVVDDGDGAGTTPDEGRKHSLNIPPATYDYDKPPAAAVRRFAIHRSAPRRHRKTTHKHVPSLPAGAVVAREQATYVTYVNPAQQRLQEALEDAVSHFKRSLKRTVTDAGWHCRRDQLWTRLLADGAAPPPSAAAKKSRAPSGAFWQSSAGGAASPKLDASGDAAAVLSQLTSSLSLAEFETLLGYVKPMAASEVDARVAPFLVGLSSAAVGRFLRALVVKFGADRCRRFVSVASGREHLVVLNPNFLDSLILFTTDKRVSGGRLSLVYKDWDSLVSDANAENRQFRMSAAHALFEDAVSCLTFVSWSKLLLFK